MARTSILLQERYGDVTRNSNTQVQLATSFLKIGNSYYETGTLLLNTGTSGVGGIDTGSVAANTFYYIYAVLNGGVPALVASTSKISPTGFSEYRKCGTFHVDGSTNVFLAFKMGDTPTTLETSFTPGLAGFGTPTTILFSYRMTSTGLNIQGRFLPVSSTATAAAIGLPFGLVYSNLAASSGRSFSGRWYRASIGTASIRKAGNFFQSSNGGTLLFGSDDYTIAASPTTALAGNVVSPTDSTIYVEASDIPIGGWVDKFDWNHY